MDARIPRAHASGCASAVMLTIGGRVTAIADKLGVEFALIHRERTRNPDGPEKMEVLVGDVCDKVSIAASRETSGTQIESVRPVAQVAILVDDMIDTGNTLALAARSLVDKGAKKVYALISHGEHCPSSRACSFLTWLAIWKVSCPRRT